MTQYLMRKDKNLKELLYALDNYHSERIVVSAFSLGRRTHMDVLSSNLSKNLELKISNFWEFYTDKKEFLKINPHDDRGFKLEYQDHRFLRLYPYFEDPSDSRLEGLVKHSVFRNIVDDYLLEIFFKGKIPLEKDKYTRRDDYWKIKK